MHFVDDFFPCAVLFVDQTHLPAFVRQPHAMVLAHARCRQKSERKVILLWACMLSGVRSNHTTATVQTRYWQCNRCFLLPQGPWFVSFFTSFLVVCCRSLKQEGTRQKSPAYLSFCLSYEAATHLNHRASRLLLRCRLLLVSRNKNCPESYLGASLSSLSRSWLELLIPLGCGCFHFHHLRVFIRHHRPP
jgi:hypothetical protein